MKKVLLGLSILFITGCATTTSLSSKQSSDNFSYVSEVISNEQNTSKNSSSNKTTNQTSLSSQTTSKNSSSNQSSSVTNSSLNKDSSTSSSETIVMPSKVASYYKSVDFSLKGHSLLVALDDLLDSTSNNSFTYKNLFDVFIYSDVDPNNSKKMLSFYSGKSATRSEMNREHTWPDSRGGSYVERDPHVIRPTITKENSSRGNDFYNENGRWDPASFGNYKYRGIAARIIFYAAVKGQDSGLYLVDKNDDPKTSSGWNKTMGKLSTLLKWNLEYDIDETEITRNEVLYTKFKHCRNPFIDNRDLACRIFGDTNSETLKVCSSKK